MRLIKLDAIDSTNDFLKKLAQTQFIESYTVVSAESQTQGRGQMGAKWETEAGKNLIMSVLINGSVADIADIFLLNIATSLAVTTALKAFEIPQLAIKWPNDIMSGNKKIAGILVENIFKSDGSVVSVVGIGLNVNQLDFTTLPKASSLAVVMGKMFDRDALLDVLIRQLKSHVIEINTLRHPLVEKYTAMLFKKGVPMPFHRVATGAKFMGKIAGINVTGKLIVTLEDDTPETFDIKEIELLY